MTHHGNHYEIYKPNGGSATFNKYYYFGTNRIAARIGSTTPSNGTLFYMQGDHPSILRDRLGFVVARDDEWRRAQHAANVFSVWSETRRGRQSTANADGLHLHGTKER